MTFWLAVIVLASATYFTRSIFVLTLADRELSPVVRSALGHVAPATLAAFVASLLVGEDGVRALGPSPEVFALVVAAAIGWRFRNTPLTMLLGMVTLWIGLALT